jgi:hypothetical protein
VLARVSKVVIAALLAAITAAATGNLDASNIRIQFVDRLIVDSSNITTSAESGNGGDIDIQGSGLRGSTLRVQETRHGNEQQCSGQ